MSFHFTGIDHVQLAAPEGCEPEARSFFTGLLGWMEVPKPASLMKRGGVWFQCGMHQIHIGVQKDFIPAKKAHPAFHVRNIDALKEYILQKGIPVIEDDTRPNEGVKRFFLTDPFGNRLEFLEWL
ncbi:VOC family protein [Paenibacillus glycanilyticus]|uniref:VOC family protein n=1 Tax=Paenibacillus glycanilyticus TaxID=126569 RepID=UPI00203A57FC|nr:VOC family protein [Paenibacillus glycanilyticus]MCM3627161.1 VOC family protein [Paenibacillus glycanilyticus]